MIGYGNRFVERERINRTMRNAEPESSGPVVMQAMGGTFLGAIIVATTLAVFMGAGW